MSFKLQDRIQGIKGLPGKYKRLLLAMAKHARNDGTNIYTAKQTMADEMGVDRKTVYRNMEVMVVTGLVIEAQTHTCRNECCPKADKHFMEHGNHWTQAYSIDLVALQNVTPLPEKSRRKKSHQPRPKMSESGVPKCHANLGIGNPAALGANCESSALTSGSEKESEVGSPSLAPLATAPPAHVELQEENLVALTAQAEEPKATQHPEPNSEQIGEAENLLHAISPNITEAQVQEQLPIALAIFAAMPENTDAYDLLKWNRIHRSHKFATQQDRSLRIRNAAQFLSAVTSGNRYLLDDYDTHDFVGCDICHSRGLRHSRERLDAERREAQEAADAAQRLEDAKRWNTYPFRKPRTKEHAAAFRANRQFDFAEAQKDWIERKALQYCMDAAIVYFAEQNQPFTREEFDWVMEDMHDCHESRYGSAAGA
jgi:hypothetical protein